MPHRRLRASLLLMGSFAFGYNAATYLHELGHALAAWGGGDAVQRIVIHPFSWSYTYYADTPNHPALVSGAGVIFAALAGACVLAICWSWRGFWAVLVTMTAVCALIDNGVYLVVDGILRAGGDATSLIELGLPAGLVMGLGLVVAAAGATVAALRMHHVGLGAGDGAWSRILVLEAGIAPYLVAMLAYHLATNPGQMTPWLVYVVIGLAMLAVLGAVSAVLAMRVPWLRRQPAAEPAWPAVVASLVLGAAVVAWGLLAA